MITLIGIGDLSCIATLPGSVWFSHGHALKDAVPDAMLAGLFYHYVLYISLTCSQVQNNLDLCLVLSGFDMDTLSDYHIGAVNSSGTF